MAYENIKQLKQQLTNIADRLRDDYLFESETYSLQEIPDKISQAVEDTLSVRTGDITAERDWLIRDVMLKQKENYEHYFNGYLANLEAKFDKYGYSKEFFNDLLREIYGKGWDDCYQSVYPPGQ